MTTKKMIRLMVAISGILVAIGTLGAWLFPLHNSGSAEYPSTVLSQNQNNSQQRISGEKTVQNRQSNTQTIENVQQKNELNLGDKSQNNSNSQQRDVINSGDKSNVTINNDCGVNVTGTDSYIICNNSGSLNINK